MLKRVGIEKARAAIVLLSDPRASRQTIRRCRALSASLFLLARTRYLADIPALASEGANEVVAEEFETSLEIASRTLRHLGFPVPWVESEAAEIRSTHARTASASSGPRRLAGGSPASPRRHAGGDRLGGSRLVRVGPFAR